MRPTIALLLAAFASSSVFAVTPDISAGANHVLSLKDNGEVWTWGDNSKGQLGLPGFTASAAPLKVPLPSGRSGIGVAGGRSHSLVLLNDKTVLSFGENNHGQLGRREKGAMAPSVVPGLNEVIAVAAGGYHSVILKRGGTVWTFGLNKSGQLGDGTTHSRTAPAPVTGLENIVAVAAGLHSSYALQQDGTVLAWGENGRGQLGDGSTEDRTAPVRVQNLSEITAIAAGWNHASALKNGGTVWVWGDNTHQQLGKYNSPFESQPQRVSDITDAEKIAAGATHTVVLKSDDQIWAFGVNKKNALGVRLTNWLNPGPHRPQKSWLGNKPVKITAGLDSTFALEKDGTISACGSTQYGQMGNGRWQSISKPVQIDETKASKISCGASHSVLCRSDGSVGWIGFYHTLPTRDDARVAELHSYSPVMLSGFNNVVQVASGDHHTVILKRDGTVWAYGAGDSGQLGNDTNMSSIREKSRWDTNPKLIPVQVTGITDAIAVAAGGSSSLAIKRDLSVVAWGNNSFGQLGNGTTTNQQKPVVVKGLTGITSVAMGKNHAIACNKTNGTVWIWGSNEKQQIAMGGKATITIPQQVPNLSNAKAVAAGEGFSLVLLADHSVLAWGVNDVGQLGLGDTTLRSTPTAISGLTGVEQIAAGSSHAIVRLNNGTLKAWGENSTGQVGDGTFTNQLSPAVVHGLTDITDIAAGKSHSFAVRNDSTAWSWGDNEYEQLGVYTEHSHESAIRLITNSKDTDADGMSDAWEYVHFGDLSHTGTADSDGDGRTDIQEMHRSDPTLADTDGNNRTDIADSSPRLDLDEDGVPDAWARFFANKTAHLDGTRATQKNAGPTGVANPANAPTNANIQPAIAAGAYHVLSLKDSGELWAWGANTNGQLGLSGFAASAEPVKVPLPSGQIGVGIAGGGCYSLVLLKNGTVLSFGENNHGQLGRRGDETTPLLVPRLAEVTAVAAGAYHSLVLKRDGTVYSFGLNRSGQLGDGTTVSRAEPVRVGGLNGVIAIAAGLHSSYALKQDKTVVAWGNNVSGQLGDGSTENRTSPVQIQNLTGITAIAAGWEHASALKNDQTVWTWGNNSHKQLGRSSRLAESRPQQVSYNNINAEKIAAGAKHTVVVKTDGNLWIFGSDKKGKDFSASYWSWTRVSGIVSVAAGEDCTFVLKKDGTISACGSTRYGQMGDGHWENMPRPVQVYEETRASKVTCGASHSVVRRADGNVGWIGAYDIQKPSVGEQNSNKRAYQLKILSTLGNITQIASGDQHTVALTSNGAVWAYGAGKDGQLGDGKNADNMTPVQVIGITDAIAVAAGGSSSLAIKKDLSVVAWGNNSFGQLGDGTTTNQEKPVVVKGLTGITSVAMGKNHATARKSDGTLWIWGNNDKQQIVAGRTASITIPQQVPGLSNVQAVAAGDGFSLALLVDHSVFAWGVNDVGQLGLGDTTLRSTPTPISGLTGVEQIAAGSSHVIVRLHNGTLKAWGRNAFGQVGDATFTNQLSPVVVHGLTGITDIAAGKSHSFAVRNDSTAWSWGDNEYEQLGVDAARWHQVATRLVTNSRDTDTDGMLDILEYIYFGDLSHTGTDDSDGDGWTDIREILLGTDPTLADTDRDNLTDIADSSTSLDLDSDRVPDAWARRITSINTNLGMDRANKTSNPAQSQNGSPSLLAASDRGNGIPFTPDSYTDRDSSMNSANSRPADLNSGGLNVTIAFPPNGSAL